MSSLTQLDAPRRSNATTNCEFFSIIWNGFTLPRRTKELVKSHPVKACKDINALQAAVPIAVALVLTFNSLRLFPVPVSNKRLHKIVAL